MPLTRAGEAIPQDAATTFIDAASGWLTESGPAHAARVIARLGLRSGVTPDDLCNDTFLSVLATVERNGVPFDPSDDDAVAAYVYSALRNRGRDRLRATKRQQRRSPWGDDRIQAMPDHHDGVETLLGDLLFECVRDFLQRRAATLRDVFHASIALAALLYLQIGTPPGAPAPKTKGTTWTRAGWAALWSVDREQFFPPETRVEPNTATQRRRAALNKARALMQDAVTECGRAAT